MPDIIITPSSGKLEFVDTSAQSTRRHSFTMDANDGLNLDAHLSAAAISAPLNVINVTVNNSNVNYPFVLAQSGETGAKNLLMDGAGGTYNPFTNTATIDISGNSATTTLASNSTNLGGVAAASYVTLTGTQTLTNKTITGTFTGNLTGTGSWATNAVNANTATNSTQLNGQSDSYYTNIPARLGYTPVNKAGDTISGNLTVNGNFAVNGSVTAFSASNIYITSSTLTVTDNILLMNALSPYQRYAGIQMYDSGSGTVSQFLWDGEGDYFFLTGSSVNGKIITGPDGQTNLTSNFIPKATAGYKLGNSLIYDNGTNVGIGTTSPATKLDVVGDVTMPAIKQSATLYNGTDISDDNSTRTVYFNIPAGGYSPITYFKVARIKITGNYQNVSLNGYFTAANSALHVGFERKVEFDFIAYAATNAGAPQVTYIKRGQDTTTVLVYAVANGGGAGTTYYDVYIKHGWYNDTHGELAIRVGYSSAVTVWQAGLDSGTSAPVDTLVNPNSNYNFDTTGFVGIGTTTPSRKLHVYSSGLSDNTVNPLLLIDGKFTAAGVDSNDIVGIAFRVENSAGGSQTTTCIGSSYQGAGNALLLQPVSGNVGVGTINPSFKLDIGAAGNDVVSVRLTPGYERVRYYGFDLLGYNDGNLWMIGNNPTNTLVLGKTWDWDNQIGIAYTPGTVGNSGGILQIGQISKNNANYTHGITRLYTNGLERITIIANGNVGISTTLPTTPLHVVGVISGSSFSGAGTGLTGTASGLSIGGSATTWTTARTLTIGSTGKSVNGSADVSWSLTELGVGNGTITIAAGTGVGVGTTNTFTTNQSGATTVTITNTGVTSLTTNTGLSSNVSATGAVTVTNTGVTSNVAGTGISVSGATGAVTITNSGVTSAVAGTGVSVSGATGAVTFSIGQAVGTGNSPTFAGLVSTGNVGIGTTSATARLHVSGSTGGVFEVDTAGNTTSLYVSASGNIGVNTTDFSYTTSDNSRLVGSNTNNKLFVNGSIQLLGNNDAIVFGRGTATFLTDEELGFGWGGGWYMVDDTWVRVRNNKYIYGGSGVIRSDGEFQVGGSGTYFLANSTETRISSAVLRVVTDSITAANAGTRGFILDGNYTNGQYRHRWRKYDDGNGLPLYIDYAHATANSYTTLARFGGGGSYNSFTVYGTQDITGNLGIGTTNPISRLQVGNLTSTSTATPETISLGGTFSNSAGSNIKLKVYEDVSSIGGMSVSSGQMEVNTWSNGKIAFYRGTTQTAIIDNVGNVGIGTSNPSWLLTVYAASAPQFALSNGTRSFILTNNSADNLLSFYYNSSNRLQFDLTNQWFNTGNLGIGTTSPAALLNIRASAPSGATTAIAGTNLQIDSNSSNYISFINTADNGTYAGLVFTDNNNGAYIVFRNYTGDITTGSDSLIYGTFQDHIFQTGFTAGVNSRTEVMRIKNSGYVGINTNNPTARLQVVQGNSGGVAAILLSTDESTIQGPSANTQIRMGSNLVLNASSIIPIGTNGSERVRIQSDGNVGIGTTSAGRKLDVEGIVRTRGASGTGGFEISAASSGTAKWRIEWDSASDSLDFNWVG